MRKFGTAKSLKRSPHNLSLLSEHRVRDLYERAYRECLIINSRTFPPPWAMQELCRRGSSCGHGANHDPDTFRSSYLSSLSEGRTRVGSSADDWRLPSDALLESQLLLDLLERYFFGFGNHRFYPKELKNHHRGEKRKNVCRWKYGNHFWEKRSQQSGE